LLELLQPAVAEDLLLPVRTTGAGKEESLLSYHFISQAMPSSLIIPHPVGQRFFNIRDSALGPFDRRSTSIFWVKVLVLLA
jgi:hypothetical protein